MALDSEKEAASPTSSWRKSDE